MQVINDVYFQKSSNALNNLQTTFDEIKNDQDKLVSEFVKKVDNYMLDMLRELDQINIEANVIIELF